MSGVIARYRIFRTGLPCPENSIVVRTTIKQTSLFIACYTSAMVNQTSAHTKTYRTAGDLAGNQIHNARAWTDTHRAPGYLLRPEHVDPRGNEHVTLALTPRAVIDEYLATNEFGKKHGRVHHKARPLREAVIVCQESTTKRDMSRLMKVLEKDLGVRTMYGHLHRDEGRIDKKTGKVKRNYHIHFGYTNLVDGQLVHMDQKKMQRMQDTCAKTLKMQRGDPRAVTKRKHLDHGAYRAMAVEQDKTQTVNAEATTAREQADSASTRAETAQQEKQDLVKANRELRQRLTDSGQARQEDHQALKRIKTDPALTDAERIVAMAEYVDERLAHAEPPAPAVLVDVKQDVPEPIRYINVRATLKPAAEELVEEKEKRQQAQSETRAAKQRVQALEKDLPETGWTPPRVKVRKETKYFGPDQWVETEKASQYRQRVDGDIDLFLAKQRKADQEALDEEKQQARQQAEAAAQANVQQELQRLQAQEIRYLELQTNHQDLETKHKNLETDRDTWKKKFEELTEKVKPYIEALKQLPERLVSKFNGFLSSLAEHVNTKDREKGQDVERE